MWADSWSAAGALAGWLLDMDRHRTERVSETVREELAELIGLELRDPRLAGVAVTDVRVAPDLRHAHVRVGVWGGEREEQNALAALEHARHYLRHELARRLNLRKIPELHFESSPAANPADRIDLLLKRAKKMRRSTESQP